MNVIECKNCKALNYQTSHTCHNCKVKLYEEIDTPYFTTNTEKSNYYGSVEFYNNNKKQRRMRNEQR